MKKILLYGIGSYKNRGVEAIVKSTIDQINKDYQLTVANLYNEENSKSHTDKISKYISHLKKGSKISDTYTKDIEKIKRHSARYVKRNKTK